MLAAVIEFRLDRFGRSPHTLAVRIAYGHNGHVLLVLEGWYVCPNAPAAKTDDWRLVESGQVCLRAQARLTGGRSVIDVAVTIGDAENPVDALVPIKEHEAIVGAAKTKIEELFQTLRVVVDDAADQGSDVATDDDNDDDDEAPKDPLAQSTVM